MLVGGVLLDARDAHARDADLGGRVFGLGEEGGLRLGFTFGHLRAVVVVWMTDSADALRLSTLPLYAACTPHINIRYKWIKAKPLQCFQTEEIHAQN